MAQGLGQALLEEARHDESGQNLSVPFVDYPLLTAWEMPELASDFVETPTPPSTRLAPRASARAGRSQCRPRSRMPSSTRSTASRSTLPSPRRSCGRRFGEAPALRVRRAALARRGARAPRRARGRGEGARLRAEPRAAAQLPADEAVARRRPEPRRGARLHGGRADRRPRADAMRRAGGPRAAAAPRRLLRRAPADPQRGTACGSVAHADPASELPCALLALGGARGCGRPAASAISRSRTSSSAPTGLRSSRTSCSWRSSSGAAYRDPLRLRRARAGPRRLRLAGAPSSRARMLSSSRCSPSPTARSASSFLPRPRTSRARRRHSPFATCRTATGDRSPRRSSAVRSRRPPGEGRPRRERRARRARRRAAAAPLRLPTPRAPPNRDEGRLRARRLRCLHRPPRRPSRPLVPAPRRASGRRRDYHGRGPRRARAAHRLPGVPALQCGYCTPGSSCPRLRSSARRPSRATRTSAPRSRATSAVAPATSRSSPRCGSRPSGSGPPDLSGRDG